MKQRHVKLFLDNHTVIDFIAPKQKGQQLRRGFLSKIEHSLYLIGLAILSPLRAISKLASKGEGILVIDIIHVKELRRSLVIFLILAAVAASLQYAGPLLSQALELKSRVLGSVDEGVGQLLAAQQSLEQQQVGSAQAQFYQAFANFKTSSQELSEAGAGIKALANLTPQKRDGDNFLLAAQHLSRAGVFLTKTFALTDSLKISAEGIVARESNPKESLTTINSNLSEIIRDINASLALLENISPSSIPEGYRTEFADSLGKLAAAKSSLAASSELADLAQSILLGRKNVLLLLQNNNELRATGGFLGTFGDMQLLDGRIANLHISSIYDLDGQLKELIIPPQPLFAVNDHWYMRDSNWFADFPTSARTIADFYEKEGGESPDLIMATTPNLVITLLELTGPISMPRYGLTLTKDNFVETTQVATSVSYDRVQNQPKQMLADFFPLLLGALSSLDASRQLRIVEILQKQLQEKQLLLYSRDPDLQKRFSAYNWAGELKSTDRDYLSIVSNNLGGTKTDTYITQKVDLESQLEDNGTLTNKLTVTRSSPLPNTAEFANLDFVRIYVPLGSTLVGSEGFESNPIDVPVDEKAARNEAVSVWESKLYKNIASGLMVGEESGKTFFGGWMRLAGGESKIAGVTYTVPLHLKTTDRMSLLVQKQAGSNSFVFNYQLNLLDRSLAWKNKQLINVSGGKLTVDDTIASDQYYGLVLRKEEQ